MVTLFALEFIEGNTITRLYFLRLRLLTLEALARGHLTPELERARQAETVPTFTHFLDIPLLMVIISLGAIRPTDWTQFLVGVVAALLHSDGAHARHSPALSVGACGLAQNDRP